MLKKVYKGEISNNIKIYYVKNDELPLISFAIGFCSGSYLDPKGKEGLFYLTSNLIDKSYDTFSTFKIREFFDSIGAKFNIVCSKNMLSIKILSEEKFFEKIVHFIHDLIFYPPFKEEEIEKEKNRIISEILQDEEEPENVISKKFYEVLYENTPISHPLEGYIDSINSIEKVDIEEFYREKVLKRKIFVAGTGSIDFERFFKKFENFFDGLNKFNFTYPEFKRVKVDKKILLIKRKVNQAFVRLGHFSLNRKNKNYHKLILSNYILGGGAIASRLYLKIRNKLGFVYSIYSKFKNFGPFKGSFYYYFQTGTENFEKAIEVLIDEVKKFKLKGVSERELREAKGFFKGSIPREIETYSQISGVLLSALQYELKPSFIYDTLNKILKTEDKELNEFINKFYDYENLCGVIIIPEDYDFSFLKNIFPEHKIELV